MPPLHWLRSFHLSVDSEDSLSHGAAATSSTRAQLGYMLRRRCSYYFRRLRCSVSQLQSKQDEHNQSGLGTYGVSSATVGRIQSGLSSVWSFDELAASQSHTGSGFQFDDIQGRSPCTGALLVSYLATHWAQFGSPEKKLYFWGAKVNSSIRGGQIWRLLTSAFLHNNALHLMVNCYSMNNIGPAVEDFYGTEKFLGIYLTSVLSGSMMSYLFEPRMSVGASGAIFGLVGATWVYIWRNKDKFDQPEKHLNSLSLCLALNVAVGLMLRRYIDNWAHVGGLLGGTFFSWYCLADTRNT